ncbi:MAG TPA: hypothetical protein VFR58_13265 [Flavisolibacter sp.]|nr:hypothetical protein [Flavisolibacter sp.]
MTIAINLTLIEFIALPVGALILGITIYFFLKYRRTLREALQGNKHAYTSVVAKEPKKNPIRQAIAGVEERFARAKFDIPATGAAREERPVAFKKQSNGEGGMVNELKSTIAQQQKLLTSYLRQVEELEAESREDLRKENNELQREITKLHEVIEKKDEEIEELYQQASASKKMAAKIDEVYQEFDQLQAKMIALEKQANRANNLAIELEDARHSYEQVYKELARKHEKFEEILAENQRMRQEMDVLEDKLSEANLQRQQLQKKTQFLQELNTDMQGISDTNKKLQTELRRIGELESMLNMMAEERDHLLRRKNG